MYRRGPKTMLRFRGGLRALGSVLRPAHAAGTDRPRIWRHDRMGAAGGRSRDPGSLSRLGRGARPEPRPDSDPDPRRHTHDRKRAAHPGRLVRAVPLRRAGARTVLAVVP